MAIVEAGKPLPCARCGKPIERGQLFLVAYGFEPSDVVGYGLENPLTSEEKGIVHQDCRDCTPRSNPVEVAALLFAIVEETHREGHWPQPNEEALVWEIVERLYGAPLSEADRQKVYENINLYAQHDED